MITKDALLQIILEQREIKYDKIVPRKIEKTLLSAPEVLVITGVRRCGASRRNGCSKMNEIGEL